MKMMQRRSTWALLFIAALCMTLAGSASAQNVLTNGDVELGDTTDFLTAGGPTLSAIDTEAHSGTYSVLYDGDGAASWSNLRFHLGAGVVDPGTVIYVSGYAKTPAASGATGTLQASLEIRPNDDGGTAKYTGTFASADLDDAGWSFFEGYSSVFHPDFGSETYGAAGSIKVRLGVAGDSTQDFLVDDVVIAPVVNYAVNSGFETGDGTGWAISGDMQAAGVYDLDGSGVYGKNGWNDTANWGSDLNASSISTDTPDSSGASFQGEVRALQSWWAMMWGSFTNLDLTAGGSATQLSFWVKTSIDYSGQTIRVEVSTQGTNDNSDQIVPAGETYQTWTQVKLPLASFVATAAGDNDSGTAADLTDLDVIEISPNPIADTPYTIWIDDIVLLDGSDAIVATVTDWDTPEATLPDLHTLEGTYAAWNGTATTNGWAGIEQNFPSYLVNGPVDMLFGAGYMVTEIPVSVTDPASHNEVVFERTNVDGSNYNWAGNSNLTLNEWNYVMGTLDSDAITTGTNTRVGLLGNERGGSTTEFAARAYDAASIGPVPAAGTVTSPTDPLFDASAASPALDFGTLDLAANQSSATESVLIANDSSATDVAFSASIQGPDAAQFSSSAAVSAVFAADNGGDHTANLSVTDGVATFDIVGAGSNAHAKVNGPISIAPGIVQTVSFDLMIPAGSAYDGGDIGFQLGSPGWGGGVEGVGALSGAIVADGEFHTYTFDASQVTNKWGKYSREIVLPSTAGVLEMIISDAATVGDQAGCQIKNLTVNSAPWYTVSAGADATIDVVWDNAVSQGPDPDAQLVIEHNMPAYANPLVIDLNGLAVPVELSRFVVE